MHPLVSLISTLLSAGLIFIGFSYAWPLIALWLGQDDLLTALTTFGLSLGLLTLWMLALAGLNRLSVWPVLGFVAVALAIGAWRNPAWFRLAQVRAILRDGWRSLTRRDLSGLAAAAIVLSLAVVLVYDLYYPFMAVDTLARYALHARLIYESGGLPADVRGFPQLVSLGYVYTWLVNGSVNEHLAKLVPVAFGAGMVGASLLLGRSLVRESGRLNGLFAGAIVAMSPLFVNWATTGNTDIPTGFYVALSTLFAIRWCEAGNRRDALLAGILAGMAVWTKQSALLLLASLVAVAVLRGVINRKANEALSGLVLLVVPVLVIAGPWYLRNYLTGGAGDVVVLPGQFHLLGVRPQLTGVFPPLQYPGSFGWGLMPLFVVGNVLALWRATTRGWTALRGRGAWPVADLVGLAVVIPYWLAWWTRFSFDPRFLLVILPIYAMWAAWPLNWLVARFGWTGRRAWLVGAPIAALLLASGVAERAGAASYALSQPFATDADKLLRTREDLYPTVHWFEENLEPGDRVLSMDGRLHYYLTAFEFETAYPRDFEQIAEYDYVVDFSATTSIYPALGWTDSDYWRHRRDPAYFEEVFDGGAGSEIFRVLPPVKEAP